MAKGVWGIDVSKYSVKVVRLEGGHDGITLTHMDVVAYEGAGPDEPADLDAQIRDALRQVKERNRIGGEPVVFSLPSHSTFNRLIKLPPVDDAKIPEVVRYEAQTQIPFPIDEVLWDYQYIDRAYGPGEEKEVILFAIKRDIVEQFLANINELGLAVDGVQFGPVALFNFLLKDQDVGSACVALDMGGDNTDLVVIDGTKFWVRNLPITGNDITKALQKAFNIPFSEAEKLKLHAGQSQQAQKIFNAIQPVLRDLVNEINRSIGYYKSISKTSKFEKIVLLGNSTKTLNFQKFVSQSLQLPAARVQKLNSIQIAPSLDAGELSGNLTAVGTALGLALQGLGQSVNKVNLLPPAYLKKKELQRKKPYLAAALAALYVMVGIMGFTADSREKELKKIHDSGKDKERELGALRGRFQEVQVVDDLTKALETVASISSQRDLILKLMAETNPNIPDNGKDKGDAGKSDDDKLWVVDWKFEEVTADGKPAAVSPSPAGKMLRATLEVVISKRASAQAGRDFILNTLLNYNPQTKLPRDPKKPCAIKNKNWELVEGQNPSGFWRVEQDDNSLQIPMPKEMTAKSGTSDTLSDEGKKFSRYRVTLEIPASPGAPAAGKPEETK